MSTVGSMSMQDALQQLYAMNMISNMAPYMGQTVQGLANMGDNAVNTFQAIPDWNRYARETYEQPIMYEMQRKVGDLAHSKELYSSAYQNRKADLMNQYNNQINQSLAGDMMAQRQGQINGMEQGLQRQLAALQKFNSIMGSPLSYQGQENTIAPRTIFG